MLSKLTNMMPLQKPMTIDWQERQSNHDLERSYRKCNILSENTVQNEGRPLFQEHLRPLIFYVYHSIAWQKRINSTLGTVTSIMKLLNMSCYNNKLTPNSYVYLTDTKADSERTIAIRSIRAHLLHSLEIISSAEFCISLKENPIVTIP